MSENLARLTLLAHEAALEGDALTPAERPEWMHLPMVLLNGAPVFDTDRMRPDQEWEMVEYLERITGGRRARDVATAVSGYMAAFGRFGLRLRDVMDHVGASKPIVLKALRELADSGKVRIQEESTRGDTGSKRKRYYWTERLPEPEQGELEELSLELIIDGRRSSDSGIRYHGTAVQGVTCPCLNCRQALREGLQGERVSAARSRGKTGLLESLCYRL